MFVRIFPWLYTGILFSPFFAILFHLAILKYIDDLFIIFSLIFILANINFLTKNLYLFGKAKQFYFILILLILISFYSSVFSMYGFNLYRYILGFIFFFKPLIFFFSAYILALKNKKSALKLFLQYINYIFLVFLLFLFLNFIFYDLWIQNLPAERHGFPFRITVLFPNPGRTSFFLSIIIAYFVVNFLFYKNKKLSFIYITISFIGLYFTYIKKSILGVMGFFFFIFKKYFKLNLFYVIFIFLLFVLIFNDIFIRFYYEYFNHNIESDTSRILMLLKLYEIFKIKLYNIFFGIGFGYFGGYASSIDYSPYYYYLQMDTLWGFIPGRSSYTGDNYVAHILGEVGVIGSILYIYLHYIIFNSILKSFLLTNIMLYKKSLLFSLLILIQIYFESLGISAFEISIMSFTSFFLTGFIYGEYIKITRKN